LSILGNLTALGVLASVAGGAWVGLSQSAAPDPVEVQSEETAEPADIYLELDLVAVPLIIENRIDGYLLSRFLVQVDEDEAKRFDLNLETYLRDAVYRQLIATTASLNTQNTYKIFDATANQIMEKINTELGVQMVDSITIAQLDVLQNDAVLIDDTVGASNATGESGATSVQ
jgi:hypothetical protein